MKRALRVILSLFFISFAKNTNAQRSPPDTIYANHINEKIDFDGKLSEQFWLNASSVNKFAQRELDYGKL